jgi:hypothetical protein
MNILGHYRMWDNESRSSAQAEVFAAFIIIALTIEAVTTS